jgi:hypothetical protein
VLNEINTLLWNCVLNLWRFAGPLQRLNCKTMRFFRSWKKKFGNRLYRENWVTWCFPSLVEAGSHTSTVTLRVVGRGRKGKSRIWDSKIRPRVPRESDPKLTALAGVSSSCKGQTHPLVRESDSNKNLVVSPGWVLYSKRDWRLTVGRNIRLRLRLILPRVSF